MNRRFRVSSGTAAALGLLPLRAASLPTTAYVMIGEGCMNDCGFCAQAKSSTDRDGRLSRVTWPVVDEEAFARALKEAASQGRILRACAQVVGSCDSMNAAKWVVSMMSGCGLPISVSMSATSSMESVSSLIDAGADKVALPLDACTPAIYAHVKRADMSKAVDLIRSCAAAYPGRISTHVIAGLGETEEDLLTLAAEIMGIGVGIGLFAFTPLPGTRLADHRPPDPCSYRRIQACLHLMKSGLLSIDSCEFQDGSLVGIDLPRAAVMAALASGQAFRTSGCPNCNRPYYNERPGGFMYNHPEPLSADVAAECVESALRGIAFACDGPWRECMCGD